MKIASVQIQMHSQHLYQQEQSQHEELKSWIGDQRPQFATDPQPPAPARQGSGDRVTLSESALRHSVQQTPPRDSTSEATTPANDEVDPKLLAMRIILEAMTGKRITVASLNTFRHDGASAPQLPSPGETETPPPAGRPRAGWGVEYDFHQVTSEHEEVSFQAAGEVKTMDGRTMAVSLEMAMSRDASESVDIQIRAGDAALTDPLVINFAGQPTALSNDKSAFDLNSDGQTEQISLLTPGSGFLFLDRNGDGRATDGSELFGPATNSGFAELAALDADNNGWLDENDPMFAKLQVWARDVAGSDYFASLKGLNIGAILLDHQATPFSINDPQNTQLGQLTDSGLFLREDGSAGTIQEIRLAVQGQRP